MQGFPFDSQVTFDEGGTPIYDRAVSSQPLRKLIRELFTNGVMPNPSTNLQAEEGTDGMTVIVNPGFAVINGGLCKEDNSRTLAVQAADATYDRIDTVVVRWNESIDVRTADLYIVAGTPSVSPVRPALTQTESVYEIGLADIFVTHGVATITNEKITDTRMETGRCGIVSSVSEWDTTTIYQQIQADLASFQSNEEAEFLTWFDEMKDQLSEDAAGHLQLEIDGINGEIADINKALEEHTFDITTTNWVTNDNTRNNGTYTVKQTILTTSYANTASDKTLDALVLSATTDSVMSEAEKEDSYKLSSDITIGATSITVYATEATENALRIRIKGV